MKTEILLAFGAGALIGGLLISKLVAQPTTPTTVAPPQLGMTTSRWTSQYHGPAYGQMPGAGVAEYLYPYGEMHKMTELTPYATTAGIYGASPNGSLIYVD